MIQIIGINSLYTQKSILLYLWYTILEPHCPKVQNRSDPVLLQWNNQLSMSPEELCCSGQSPSVRGEEEREEHKHETDKAFGLRPRSFQGGPSTSLHTAPGTFSFRRPAPTSVSNGFVFQLPSYLPMSTRSVSIGNKPETQDTPGLLNKRPRPDDQDRVIMQDLAKNPDNAKMYEDLVACILAINAKNPDLGKCYEEHLSWKTIAEVLEICSTNCFITTSKESGTCPERVMSLEICAIICCYR